MYVHGIIKKYIYVTSTHSHIYMCVRAHICKFVMCNKCYDACVINKVLVYMVNSVL